MVSLRIDDEAESENFVDDTNQLEKCDAEERLPTHKDLESINLFQDPRPQRNFDILKEIYVYKANSQTIMR